MQQARGHALGDSSGTNRQHTESGPAVSSVINGAGEKNQMLIMRVYGLTSSDIEGFNLILFFKK